MSQQKKGPKVNTPRIWLTVGFRLEEKNKISMTS